jgi:hypothetical protein
MPEGHVVPVSVRIWMRTELSGLGSRLCSCSMSFVGVGVSVCVFRPLLSLYHWRFHCTFVCHSNVIVAADFRFIMKSGFQAVLSESLGISLPRRPRCRVHRVASFASWSASSLPLIPW